jgi:hypothetical protein
MLDVYISIGIFVLVNLSYLVVILNERNLKKYINKSREITMLKKKYNLDLDKLNHKKVAFTMGFVNALAISIVYLVFMLIKNIVLKILVAFIASICLTLFLYSLVGKHFRKEMNK